MTDYRPVPEEDADAYREILNYAFRLHEGPLGPNADEHLYPSFGERRGIYEGDELRTICRHYFLETSLRGGTYTMGGYTVIATPPAHRGKGYVSYLTEATLREYHNRDVHIAALWPFNYEFYRRFGWGLANRYAEFELPPSALEGTVTTPNDHDNVVARRLHPEEYRLLEPVLAAHGEPYELTIFRPEGWWRGRTFARHGRGRYVFGFERDRSMVGYLAFTVVELDHVDEMGHGATRLDVHDMAWVDRPAYHELLRFLADHDSQVDVVRIAGPIDSPLPDIVDEPDKLDIRHRPGGMLRLVSVDDAIEMLEYPVDVAGRVVVEVNDAHAPWNNGPKVIEVAGGRATCEQTDEAPAVVMDISRFSQLVVGARSIHSLVAAGHAEVKNERTVETLDAIFPEANVYLREFF